LVNFDKATIYIQKQSIIFSASDADLFAWLIPSHGVWSRHRDRLRDFAEVYDKYFNAKNNAV